MTRTLTPAPEYDRDTVIRHYVADDGVIYEGFDSGFYKPSEYLHGMTPLPGHRIDRSAPIICSCGNDRLHVMATDAYETSARCPECGHSEVIHDG